MILANLLLIFVLDVFGAPTGKRKIQTRIKVGTIDGISGKSFLDNDQIYVGKPQRTSIEELLGYEDSEVLNDDSQQDSQPQDYHLYNEEDRRIEGNMETPEQSNQNGEIEQIIEEETDETLQSNHQSIEKAPELECETEVIHQDDETEMLHSNRESLQVDFAPPENPFKCQVEGCGATFTDESNLKAHQRAHSGTKQFKCTFEGCNQVFTTPYALKKHLCTHTGQMPFKCTYEGCNRAFVVSCSLKTHTLTHTGEKAFNCLVEGCGKAFASKGNLKTHQRAHTGERPFVCNFEGCNRVFGYSSQLKRHQSFHTS